MTLISKLLKEYNVLFWNQKWPYNYEFIFLSAGQVSHGRPGALLGERSKQLFQSPVIPVSMTVRCNCIVSIYVYIYLKDVSFSPLQTRHFQSQPGFSAGGTEHGQYSGAQPTHSPYGVTQQQHTSPFASGQPVPANYASGSQLRGIMFVFLVCQMMLACKVSVMSFFMMLLCFSRCICISGNAVFAPPATDICSSWSLHITARCVWNLFTHRNLCRVFFLSQSLMRFQKADAKQHGT